MAGAAQWFSVMLPPDAGHRPGLGPVGKGLFGVMVVIPVAEPSAHWLTTTSRTAIAART